MQERKTPTIMTGGNPCVWIKTAETEAKSHILEVCTDAIHDAELALLPKRWMMDPIISPKLVSIPCTTALFINGPKQIVHAQRLSLFTNFCFNCCNTMTVFEYPKFK